MKLATAIAVIILSLSPLSPNLRPLVKYLHEPNGRGTLAKQAEHTALPIPVKVSAETLQLGAASSYAIDFDTATVLHSRDQATKRPIASITKLVTAMVILRSHSLDEIVTIPALPVYGPQDALVNLQPGQKFILRDLLKAALIPSGNDAADALAIIDSGSKEAFSAKMNDLVASWGINNTHFTNPSGLSDVDNYASAESLAKLGKVALANSDLAAIAATATQQITDLSGRPYSLVTTNRLLADRRFGGLKTGYTAAAGQSVITLVNINGHRVITVVLDSPDRFAETLSLVNYLERNYKWQ